ncbi:MAG TPA: hypothetical protein VK821_08990 [Dehalococcoidia bacterium]|nr:hypothetical protein [Dehalococcoidia bacterium]
MQADTLTLAGRYYDGTAAIFRGIAGLPGLHLQVKEETSVPKMFTGSGATTTPPRCRWRSWSST